MGMISAGGLEPHWSKIWLEKWLEILFAVAQNILRHTRLYAEIVFPMKSVTSLRCNAKPHNAASNQHKCQTSYMPRVRQALPSVSKKIGGNEICQTKMATILLVTP
jgi:hypothetical protein